MSMKPLGILMLDTRFPRIEGDIGNPASFDFPVIFRTMAGIGSADAVAAHPDRSRVLAALKTNAEALTADGKSGLDRITGGFDHAISSTSNVFRVYTSSRPRGPSCRS